MATYACVSASIDLKPPCPSEDYRLEKCEVPEVGEQEMLVKVLAVGICAGDAKCYAGAPYFWGKVEPAS